MKSNPATYATVTGIARKTGVHRSVILRLLSHGVIKADSLLEIGLAPQPIFRTAADRIAQIQYAANGTKVSQ